MKQLPQKQSLVAQTVAVLKGEIQSGDWKHGLPAERKLCEQLVISRGTLRAALDCLRREGLIKSRQGSGWEITNRKPNRLSSATKKSLVLLTPQPLHVLTPFSIFWIDNLREHLGEAGYHLDVRHERACFARNPDRALEELAHRVRPAGWVINSSTARMQHWFSKRSLPCVITGSRHEGVRLTTVDRDLTAACRHAAGMLIAKGHTRLVLLNPKSGLAGDIDCETGFREVANRLLPKNGEVIIAHHDGTRDGVCRRFGALLRHQPAATGFLVSGPKYAITALGLLLRKGIRLPQDAAFISRDDDSFLQYVVPSIARYSTDPTLFARKVSRTVLRLVQGGTVPPQDIRVMPRFVPGETFG